MRSPNKTIHKKVEAKKRNKKMLSRTMKRFLASKSEISCSDISPCFTPGLARRFFSSSESVVCPAFRGVLIRFFGLSSSYESSVYFMFSKCCDKWEGYVGSRGQVGEVIGNLVFIGVFLLDNEIT